MIRDVVVGVVAAITTALILWFVAEAKRFPTILSVPKGAVVAFDSENCPDDGWANYKPAYGRFIRGIDPAGTTDPQGVRLSGSIQADDIKAHVHESDVPVFVHRNNGGPRQEDMNPGSWGGYMKVAIGSTGGAESRPKNVALLYCRKM